MGTAWEVRLSGGGTHTCGSLACRSPGPHTGQGHGPRDSRSRKGKGALQKSARVLFSQQACPQQTGFDQGPTDLGEGERTPSPSPLGSHPRRRGSHAHMPVPPHGLSRPRGRLRVLTSHCQCSEYLTSGFVREFVFREQCHLGIESDNRQKCLHVSDFMCRAHTDPWMR